MKSLVPTLSRFFGGDELLGQLVDVGTEGEPLEPEIEFGATSYFNDHNYLVKEKSKCIRVMNELAHSLHFPLSEQKEEEARVKVQDMVNVCEDAPKQFSCSELREEARQDMELMVQRMMSQRDQGYQPQQPQQHPQHIPARHSTYASSHPHQQQPRPSPQMPSRHSIHETSQLRPIQPQTSSYHESGGSSQHPARPFGTYSYQELGYRPTFDNNQPASQVLPFTAAFHRVNVNLISDQDMLEQILGPNNHAGNQGGNQDRSGGR
ncbi:hypothetical protein P8452_64755 [Trifolium repens]|nr:hypothetical protein P8452_64755 [Trifolium repens]